MNHIGMHFLIFLGQTKILQDKDGKGFLEHLSFIKKM